MFYGYLKIAISLTVPLATLQYAAQARCAADMRAIKSDVEHPPELKWMLDHPRESLQQSRAEAKYLRQLIRDLDR